MAKGEGGGGVRWRTVARGVILGEERIVKVTGSCPLSQRTRGGTWDFDYGDYAVMDDLGNSVFF